MGEIILNLLSRPPEDLRREVISQLVLHSFDHRRIEALDPQVRHRSGQIGELPGVLIVTHHGLPSLSITKRLNGRSNRRASSFPRKLAGPSTTHSSIHPPTAACNVGRLGGLARPSDYDAPSDPALSPAPRIGSTESVTTTSRVRGYRRK